MFLLVEETSFKLRFRQKCFSSFKIINYVFYSYLVFYDND